MNISVLVYGTVNPLKSYFSIISSALALHQIMDFVANNTHTNIALITAPPRHDLM